MLHPLIHLFRTPIFVVVCGLVVQLRERKDTKKTQHDVFGLEIRLHAQYVGGGGDDLHDHLTSTTILILVTESKIFIRVPKTNDEIGLQSRLGYATHPSRITNRMLP